MLVRSRSSLKAGVPAHGLRFLTAIALAALLVGVGFACSDDSGGGGGTPTNNPDNNDNNDRNLFEVPQCNMRDNPEDCAGWRCYRDDSGRVCETTRPDHPDGGPGWVCSDDALAGYTVCERAGGGDDFDGGSGWTCTDDANGGTTCTRDDPGGTDGWDCSYVDGDLVCTRTDYTDGGPGWDCYDDATGTHCESDDPSMQDDTPDGSGWVCRNEGGTRICDDVDGGSGWDCYDDADGSHCSTRDPDLQDDEPSGGGWECVNDGDTRTCDNDHFADDGPDGNPVPGQSTDNPTGGPGWTCEDSQDGRVCIYDGPDGNGDGDPDGSDGSDGFDTPDGGPGWTCETVGDERICHRDDDTGGNNGTPNNGTDNPDGYGDGWDCSYDADRDVTVCVNEPETPTDEPGWLCYEEDGKRVCSNGNPGTPGDGEGGPCGDVQGNVQGRVCAPSGDFWVAGADVTVTFTNCEGEAITATTQSDAEGYFLLTGVGVGTQTITVSRGPFETTYEAEIRAGQTTTIPLGDFCFDQSTNIAVISGQYDQIGAVLESLGFRYDLYDGYPDSSNARQLLADLGAMNDYDVIFANCGTSYLGITNNPTTLNTIRSNIESYVDQGGSFYASDWDWLFVEEPFPTAIDFRGTDGSQGDVLMGASGYRPARVIDPELRAVLGEDRVTLNFDYPNWAIAEAVTADVDVFIEADIVTVQGQIVSDVPILMRFNRGQGTVLFTSYHVHQNQPLTDIFYYLVFAL